MKRPFYKMNGAGNDFVVIDAREDLIRLTPDDVRRLSARGNETTQGCDQLIVLERSKEADVFMRIYNADGSQVDACGNATRCVAGLLEGELQRLPVSIRTNAGLLQGLQKAYTEDGQEYVLVDMGKPRFFAEEIPLAVSLDEARRLIAKRVELPEAQFVNMGNPHVVFFLGFNPQGTGRQDEKLLLDLPFETLGQQLETMRDVFPQGVNVSIALLRAAKDAKGHLVHMRVWERGAGLTQACGTAACAVLAAANIRDTSVRSAHIWFEPFATQVTVKLSEEGHVLLGGPVVTEFTGQIAV